MSRMNGQFTFETPSSATATGGDNLNTTSGTKIRMFTAYERTTVVEVGVVPDAAPGAAFAFDVLKRTGGATNAAADSVISVFTSAFAAEGGIAGDPSIQNFDEGNKITNGIITNAGTKAAGGKCLRAFCEVSLDKGDQLVFRISTANGSALLGTFYAKAFPNGAGLVEGNDVDSN